MKYLEFGDNISLLGMLKYKDFICCFGDIVKDNCRKILNIAQTLRYPLWGAIMPGILSLLLEQIEHIFQTFFLQMFFGWSSVLAGG